MTEGPCSRASSNIITGCKYCSRDLLFIWEQSNERRAAAPASAGMPMAGRQDPAASGKGQRGLNVGLPLQTLRKKYPGCLAKLIPARDAWINIGVRGAPAGLGFAVQGRGCRELPPDPARVARGVNQRSCGRLWKGQASHHHGWGPVSFPGTAGAPCASLT